MSQDKSKTMPTEVWLGEGGGGKRGVLWDLKKERIEFSHATTVVKLFLHSFDYICPPPKIV